ncbi:MAG: hypothetical protein ACSLFE_04350 [Gemmatimonadaceae bacterium]
MRRIFLSLAAALPLSALAANSMAQSPATDEAARVPVTIALTDRIPPGSRFVVKRIPTAARQDVLALRPDATPAELTAAVTALLAARQAEGDFPTTERTLRLRPKHSTAVPRGDYPWAARVLADVRTAEPTTVPGIGKVQAVEIWLPRVSRKQPQPPDPRSS